MQFNFYEIWRLKLSKGTVDDNVTKENINTTLLPFEIQHLAGEANSSEHIC